ncbi:MAG: DNA repair protein RecO, partial [Planctomycetia bacterium]|nr:DNA repair protein RecO [Planctomycetia bacterium]
MASESSTAMVLRLTEWSESSLVLTFFTREYGKLHALAKGARRPKAPFDAALDILSECRITMIRKSSDALNLLTEAKLIRWVRLPRELSRWYAGFYIAELLDALTETELPIPELFDLTSETVRFLSGGVWNDPHPLP